MQQKDPLKDEVLKNKGLNEKQCQAVYTTEGRVLVLAGAGSGKTRVLMERIAYLIRDKQVCPKSILALTFTNKAAHEMRQRLAKMIGSQMSSKVTLSTFHSFCLQVLRQIGPHFGLERNFTLYSEYDMRRLFQRLAREILSCEGQMPSMSSTLLRIELARNRNLEPKDLDASDEPWHDEFCQELYTRAKEAMRIYRAVDFNGLLEEVLRVLTVDPQTLDPNARRAREVLASTFAYIMVDEYQDTNPIQDALAHALAKHHGNLCVVGDDDQSIYGWRGASVKNILNFNAQTVIKLEQNYRSTNYILKAANAVIHKNADRYAKSLWSAHEDGQKIDVWHAPDEHHEARSVVDRIKTLHSKSVPWSQIAVLYRSNVLKNVLEGELMRASFYRDCGGLEKGIPYKVYGGQSLYESKEIIDIQNYLKMLLNPHDETAWLAVVNQPRRGIGESTLEEFIRVCKTFKQPLSHVFQKHFDQLPLKVRSRMQAYRKWCQEAHRRVETQDLGEFLNWLVDSIDYHRSIEEEVKSEKMRVLKKRNIADYLEQAREFCAKGDGECSQKAIDFLEQTTLDRTHIPDREQAAGNTLSLMTFHSSKGLEFPYVFLLGIEDDVLPHKRSLEEGGIEEERRLFYVALTRAKKRLFISMSTSRQKMGQGQACRPSRFLMDIPKELLRVVDYRWTHLD